MRLAEGGSRFLSIVFISSLVAFCCSCGGGLELGGDTAAAAWPGHGWDEGAKSGSFTAVAVDASERAVDPLTRCLELRVEPGAAGECVTIRAGGMPASDHAYLHLRYDPELVHPVYASADESIRADVLCAGILSQRGVVSIGLATIGGATSLRGDVDLAWIQFAAGPVADSPARQVCAVTDGTVDDLRFDSLVRDKLLWSYRSPGDYDQNSEVNIADVTPIGQYYQRTTASPDWAEAQTADGDENGEVNIADLTPIGSHYLLRCTAYSVLAGPTETGEFSSIGEVALGDASEPPAGGFLQFEFTVPNPIEGAWYGVSAMDGAETATGKSNLVQYSATPQYNPPTNLMAVNTGTNIMLSWTAPSGSLPDGYDVYIALSATMGSASQLADNITPLGYEVSDSYPPTGDYYFGVKAVYGPHESEEFAIVHYEPGGGTAPLNLLATKITPAPPDPAFIQLTWEAPTGTPPSGYNVYEANNEPMTGAAKLNGLALISGLSFNVEPALYSPEDVHYFGVKADYSGTESGFSNIYYYDPAAGPDTDPPVWQGGGEGIKSVEPQDGFAVVTWYAATDIKSPPVKYVIAYCPDTEELNWDTADFVDAPEVTTNIPGLVNDTRYKFAVRAQDSADPPNRTTNDNVLYGTPMVFPSDGQLSDIIANDVASVRMDGEEIPRIAAVNRDTELWYCSWGGSAWTTVDLNTVIASPDRKYHPQMLGIGDEVHIVYGTNNGVFEIYGNKDANPLTWQQKTIVGTGVIGVFGIGFDYHATEDYLAVVYATKAGTEQLFYSDRDSDGEWSAPISVMNGNPEIWQCDLALNEFDGSQWFVAAVGKVHVQDEIRLFFWYGSRASRVDTWTFMNTGYGGDVQVIDIDPATQQPLVVSAEARLVDVPLAGGVPVTDAVVYAWTGSDWQRNVIEPGDCTFDEGDFTLDTILTGQDPQLVFSPTGKAVSLWSRLDFLAWMADFTAQLTGDWRYSQRPTASWSSPASMMAHITSSNSVTAGEGYQHCVTCDLGLFDDGDYTELGNKYSERNNYVEGDLWYRRQTW